MTPFIQHTGITAPLVRDNINTDTIIPSREMRSVSSSGLSEGLFAPRRYHDPNARTLNSAFVLNKAGFSGASILLTGANFGCGSSREHAVWALLESGFRVIMATSFATIVRNNALRNGLLTIELHPDRIERLAEWVSRDPQAHTLGVDLEACTIRHDPHCDAETFSVDPNARDMLLQGLDEIGLTEQSLDEITAFEKRDQKRRPWVYLGTD